MMKFITVGFALFAASASSAATLKTPAAGCITEDALSEFTSAIASDDQRQMEALFNRVCFLISGLEYSRVDIGFLTSEVRVYVPDGSSVRLFVPTSQLNK